MDVDLISRDVCLFLDVDGSLIDLAPRPEQVTVPPSLVGDLATINAHLEGAVALVSGRPIAQLDALFAPLRLRASGVHGAEWRRTPEGPIETVAADALADALWEDLQALLQAFPGTFAENKAFSFAVHYRAVPASAAALAHALDGLVTRTGPALRVLPGHFVFEIKGAGFDKGLAVDRFLAEPPFSGRRPIFIGDDVTDRPGIAAAARAGGAGFSVSGNIPGSSGTFASPSAVREWLAAMAASEQVNA